MIKFSIPKAFLRVCERKEASIISFFLKDSADSAVGRVSGPEDTTRAPFLVGSC